MFNRIFGNKITLTVAGVAVVVALAFGAKSLISTGKTQYDTVAAKRADISEHVTATGPVSSVNTVFLSFEQSGQVSSVNVKVGDTVGAGQVIATLDSSTLQASLASAEADVETAEAHLSELESGATAQTVAVSSQKVTAANLALHTTIQSVFIQAEDAIQAKDDILFNNPDSANPTIVFNDPYEFSQSDINSQRVAIRDMLNDWKTKLTDGTSDADLLNLSTNNLQTIKGFADQLSTITSKLTPDNTGLTTAQISSYRTAAYAASAEADTAIGTLNSASQAVVAAQAGLSLTNASSTPQTIEEAQAAIDKAKAEVTSIQTEINQTYVRAPFAGVITQADPKVGEYYNQLTSPTEGFTLISNGTYQIEAQVPEVDMVKIKVGDHASTTLDAYGTSVVFDTTVSEIDPAETIVNGVASYKITLVFTKADSRIKTGMSANVDILTKTSVNAIVVPTSAVITNGANKYVLVSTGIKGQYTEKQVQTGIQSPDGFTEITSGLSEGDTVATFGASY